MGELANVCLRLRNQPENVLVVRQTLSGVADALGLDAIERNDLNTAATEACNNVVSHAYAGEEGPLEVELHALGGALAVTVRDHGVGMRRREGHPEPAAALELVGELNPAGGIGLPVIGALARSVEFKDVPGGGTEVRMEIATPNATALAPVSESSWQRIADAVSGERPVGDLSPAATSAIELRVASRALARAVLPRLLSALAARACFSTDRITEVRQLAETLATGASESGGGYLEVAVTVAPYDLDVRVGRQQLRLLERG